MKKSLKIVGFVFSVVILLMIAIYLGICVYFNHRFFPGSQINGIDASGMKVEEVEEKIAADVRDYTITLKLRDQKEEYIGGGEIEFEYVSDGAVEKLKEEQNSFFWISAYSNPATYTMNTQTTYNETLLRKAMDSLECFDESKVTKPVDAELKETSAGYEIQPEVQGNELDTDRVYEVLKTAVDHGETEIDLEAEECYLKPAVTSQNTKLRKKQKALNKYFHQVITYKIGDYEEVLNYSIIRNWITIKDDLSVDVNWNKVADWMSDLSDKYDTFGKKMTFTTTKGENVKVKHENYGWKIDEAGEVDVLMGILKSGESTERTPLYLETAMAHGENGNDIGDTYVEIDYTNQHMWFYKDGALVVDTPIVTGNTSQKMGSPEGVFVLYDKEEKAILRGDDNKTGKGYNTPVDFWMPFSGGVGIHDSKWRNTYGGTIYKGSGSHGCINTPWEAAKKIYENISVGVPIICYSSKNELGLGTESISQPVETRVIDKDGKEVTGQTEAKDQEKESEKATESDVPVVNIN